MKEGGRKEVHRVRDERREEVYKMGKEEEEEEVGKEVGVGVVWSRGVGM
jgi:hypothetical protein